MEGENFKDPRWTGEDPVFFLASISSLSLGLLDKDLESATETLSEYLERDITTDNIGEIKQKVQDKYRYCDTRRKVLLHHVQEGYDKDWWVYSLRH